MTCGSRTNAKRPRIRLFDMPDDLRVRLSRSFRAKYRLQVRTIYGATKGPYKSFFGRPWSHNGPRRSGKMTAISIGTLKEVAARLHIAQEEIEGSLHSITTGFGVDCFVKFPLIPTEDHAWLIGLLFSSGGFAYRMRDRYVRVLVDPEMLAHVLEVSRRIGNVPRVEYNSKSRLNGEVWERKRFNLIFNRVMFEILPKLGYCWHVPLRNGHGRYTAAREHQSEIPAWIVADRKMMHNFVEGYINGIRGQSWLFRSEWHHKVVMTGGIHIQFSGRKVDVMVKQIVSYLNSLGVTGLMTHEKRPCKVLQHRRYNIIGHDKINILLSSFKIYKTDLRVRCQLMLRGDPVLLQILKCLENLEIMCLGLIIEKPRTAEEVMKILRRRKAQHSIGRLLKLKVLVERKGILYYEPSVMQRQIRDEYLFKAEEMIQAGSKYLDQYPFMCTACGMVCISKKCEHCGGKAKPISRVDVIKPYVVRAGLFKAQANKLA